MNELFCSGESFFVLTGRKDFEWVALGKIISSKTKGCDFE
jgi:hypothetical protein